MSIGIMPLSDDQSTRGKCSFKMLQYMAVGMPVVVSPVGMNNEVLSKGDIGYAAVSADDWYNALEALYDQEQLRTKLGQAGRKVVEQQFSSEMVAQKLFYILKDLAE